IDFAKKLESITFQQQTNDETLQTLSDNIYLQIKEIQNKFEPIRERIQLLEKRIPELDKIPEIQESLKTHSIQIQKLKQTAQELEQKIKDLNGVLFNSNEESASKFKNDDERIKFLINQDKKLQEDFNNIHVEF